MKSRNAIQCGQPHRLFPVQTPATLTSRIVLKKLAGEAHGSYIKKMTEAIVQRNPVWAAAHTLPGAMQSRVWQTSLFWKCERGKLPWPRSAIQISAVQTNVYHTFLAWLTGMWVYFIKNGCNATRLILSNNYHMFLALLTGMWAYLGENICNRTRLNNINDALIIWIRIN